MSHHQSKTDIKPVITVDVERYVHFLDDADLSDNEKTQLLQTVWGIITEFVALGFGVHPLQQTKGICGKTAQVDASQKNAAQDMLYLDQSYLYDNFNAAHSTEKNAAKEGSTP